MENARAEYMMMDPDILMVCHMGEFMKMGKYRACEEESYLQTFLHRLISYFLLQTENALII